MFTISNLTLNEKDNMVSMAIMLKRKVVTRPVHKNLFLEFPKYPGRFMLHFDILDPVGSTVRYEMMKLCAGSV